MTPIRQCRTSLIKLLSFVHYVDLPIFPSVKWWSVCLTAYDAQEYRVVSCDVPFQNQVAFPRCWKCEPCWDLYYFHQLDCTSFSFRFNIYSLSLQDNDQMEGDYKYLRLIISDLIFDTEMCHHPKNCCIVLRTISPFTTRLTVLTAMSLLYYTRPQPHKAYFAFYTRLKSALHFLLRYFKNSWRTPPGWFCRRVRYVSAAWSVRWKIAVSWNFRPTAIHREQNPQIKVVSCCVWN